MTEEQKKLLINDLCGRLPYGVKFKFKYAESSSEIMRAIYLGNYVIINSKDYSCEINDIKPYLFPMSSITEEQANELFNLFGISLLDSVGRDYIKINECTGITFFLNKGFDVEMHLDKLMNWLNSNHFDYRGLITMGLAIDATNLNIY